MPGNLLATGRCYIWRLDMSFDSQEFKCSSLRHLAFAESQPKPTRLQLPEMKLCDFWKSNCVTGTPHRIAIAMSRYDRKRTDGPGADPDTAIYLKPPW
jgi:hypothetical protein